LLERDGSVAITTEASAAICELALGKRECQCDSCGGNRDRAQDDIRGIRLPPVDRAEVL